MTHPISPPPELVQEWRKAPEFSALSPCVMVTVTTTKLQDIATQAARWGADQELEACCEWLQDPDLNVDTYKLRAARRPKPPSLKEQALAALNEIEDSYGGPSTQEILIRRALEQLPDHE